MNTKRNLLIIIVAITLIVVIVGLPSMKFVQKLSAGCPFAQSKTALGCSPCIYRVITSPIETGDLLMAALPPIPPDVQPLAYISEKNDDRDIIAFSGLYSEITPLRC